LAVAGKSCRWIDPDGEKVPGKSDMKGISKEIMKRLLSAMAGMLALSAIAMAQGHWERCPLPDATYVTSLVVDNGGAIFAGTYSGIFRSTDRGATWTPANNGLTTTIILTMATGRNGEIFAGALKGGTNAGGIFRSTDRGNSWTDISNGMANRSIHAIGMARNGDLYAGVYRNGTSTGFYRSTDNGESWSPSSLENAGVLALAFDSTGTIYAGLASEALSGVYRSTDNGETWRGGNFNESLGSVNDLEATPSGDIYAGIFDHLPTAYNVLRSTDRGANWNPLNIENSWVSSMAIQPGMSGAEDTLYAGVRGGGLVDPESGVLTYYGVFKSLNRGSSWIPIGKELSNTNVNAVALGGGILFAGADNGLFRFLESPPSGVATTGLSREPALRISPNPAFGSATLRFSLPEPGFVHLSIVNGRGETVSTLADELIEGGEQEIQLPASSLPAGAYFIRLVERRRTLMQPFLVVR
jgi:hypothetical protein